MHNKTCIGIEYIIEIWVRETKNTYPKADQIKHSKERNKNDKMLKTMQMKPKQSKTTHAIKNSTS